MTKIQRFSTALFLFFNILLLHAQSVSGKVLTSTNEVIPYATIEIGERHGTISNEEGLFSISTKGFSENEIVKISYLGFETIEIPLQEFSDKAYVLEERFDVLSEVYLTNKKLSVLEILEKVRAQSSTNYTNNSTSKIFYRNSVFSTPKKLEFEILKASELDKKFVKSLNNQFEALRVFAKNKTSSQYTDVLLNFAQLEDSIKINVTKATQLINASKDKSAEKLQGDFIKMISKQLDSGATYKLKSGLFKLQDSLKVGDTFKDNKNDRPESKDLVSKIKSLTEKHSITEDSYFSFIYNDTKNDYELEGIVYLNSVPVYKISFIPKRKSEKFEGVLYVNTSDFAVVKLDYKLGENRFGQRLNLKALMGIKFIETKIEGSVVYQKREDGFYKPLFINNTKQQYVYLSRPLKFIKNRIDENENKSIFKFKFKVESTSLSKNELFFVEHAINTNKAFVQFKTDKEYAIDKIEAYNPEIWEDYKIISPVESIKNYHLED